MNEAFEVLNVKDGNFVRVKRYPWYLRWLLRWLQRRCQHYAMKADILEGCDQTYSVRWCETCGAFQIVINCCPTPVRACEPTFES